MFGNTASCFLILSRLRKIKTHNQFVLLHSIKILNNWSEGKIINHIYSLNSASKRSQRATEVLTKNKFVHHSYIFSIFSLQYEYCMFSSNSFIHDYASKTLKSLRKEDFILFDFVRHMKHQRSNDITNNTHPTLKIRWQETQERNMLKQSYIGTFFLPRVQNESKNTSSLSQTSNHLTV